MSQEAEYVFALEQRMREELFTERVSNKTREFYLRYQAQYDDMCLQGYRDYIPEEMECLKEDLATIDSLLSRDPVAARQVSQEVGSYIHSLWGLGREARQVFQESARIARLEAQHERAMAQNAAMSRYYEVIGSMDSIVANFAASELNGIKNDISSGSITVVGDVEAKLKAIIGKAERAASDWKAQKQQEQSQRVLVEQIEDAKKSVATEKFEDSTRSKALLDKLEEIKSRAAVGTVSINEVKEQINFVTEEADEALVGEEVRRRMARAIWNWFEAHDFSLSEPRLINDAVLIEARRPSGNKAKFKLTSDNKMLYRLDGYEGQGCLKDIASAKAAWESAYGIKLSDEVVKWQNPDRILRRQGQTESNIGGHV